MNHTLAELAELELQDRLNKADYTRYNKLYNELTARGIRPLSAQYAGKKFLEVELSKLPTGYVVSRIQNSLNHNHIYTIKDLLDLNRYTVTQELPGMGEGKWASVKLLQEKVIEDRAAIEYHLCGIVPSFSIDTASAMADSTTQDGSTDEQTVCASKESDVYKDKPLYDVQICDYHKETLGSKIYTYCESKGITRIVDVLDINEYDILTCPGYGKAAIVQLNTAKKNIKVNEDSLVEIHKIFSGYHVFPENYEYEADSSLDEQAHKGFCELTKYLNGLVTKVSEGSDAIRDLISDIDLYFINPITKAMVEEESKRLESIGQKMSIPKVRARLYNERLAKVDRKSITDTRHDQRKTELIAKIQEGSSLLKGMDVHFSKELFDDISNLKEVFLYRTAADCLIDIGKDSTSDIDATCVFQLLDLRLTDSNDSDNFHDQVYVIPSNREDKSSKSYVAHQLEYIFRAITKNKDNSVTKMTEVRPMSYEEILDTVYEYFPDEEIDEEDFFRLLESYSRVERVIDDNVCKYQLEYSYLSTEGKFARIVYEKKRINKDDIPEIDKLKNPNNTSDSELLINYCKIRAARSVKSYPWISNNHGIYTYDPDCSLPKGSPKQAVLDFVEMAKGHTFTYDEVCEYVKSKNAPVRCRQLMRQYILSLCAENVEDSNMYCRLDEQYLFKDIEWREKGAVAHADYKNKIKDRIMNVLSDLNDDMMKRSEMMHQCDDLYPTPDQYTTFYELLNELENEGKVEKVITENETFVRLKKDEIAEDALTQEMVEEKAADTEDNGAEASATQTQSTSKAATVIISNTPTQGMGLYGGNTMNEYFDWDSLEQTMCIELSTYDYVFTNRDINTPIKKFVDFIKDTVTNKDLKRFFPHHLKRFWNGSNDLYDLYDIITHIANDYEGIVRTIYESNNNLAMPQTKGLIEVISYVPALNDWKTNNWLNTSGQPAIRFLRNLYNIRNNRSHTMQLNLNRLQYTQRITEFIVLCVFTVDKFWLQAAV